MTSRKHRMHHKRILMPGEFWFGASGAGVAHGLRQLGHAVDQVEISDYMLKWNNVASKIAKRLLIKKAIQAYKAAIINQIKIFKPDILLAFKGSYLDPEFLAEVKSHGVLCVNVFPDFSFLHNDFSEDWITSYDFFISTKPFHRERLDELCGPAGFAIVPHGYSSLVHRRIPTEAERSPAFDLCYMGNADQRKATILSEILTHFPDRPAVVIGSNWSRFLDPAQFPACRFVGAMSGDAMVGTMQSSRINIAFHFGARDQTGWFDRISTRSYEIPACGAFMLHIDNPEIRELYTPGEEIAVFTTPAEAIGQIEHYLAHDEERRAIADAGWRRCVPAYSYDARCIDIMAAIDARFPAGDQDRHVPAQN
jgi:spore maturation protein CgeB